MDDGLEGPSTTNINPTGMAGRGPSPPVRICECFQRPMQRVDRREGNEGLLARRSSGRRRGDLGRRRPTLESRQVAPRSTTGPSRALAAGLTPKPVVRHTRPMRVGSTRSPRCSLAKNKVCRQGCGHDGQQTRPAPAPPAVPLQHQTDFDNPLSSRPAKRAENSHQVRPSASCNKTVFAMDNS